MIKYLDRYIIKEFISPFLFGLFIYLTIFIVDIMMGLIDLFLTKNVSFIDISRLFVYNIPNLMVIVIPMSVLFGTLLVISNLSGNSEIIAFKSGGVSFYRIVLPFFVAGIFLSLCSFFISEVIVPRANKKVQNVYNKILSQKPLPDIKVGDFNLIEGKNVFYTSKKEDESFFQNILFEVKKKFPVLIISDKSFINGKNWEFSKGNIYDFGENAQNMRRIDFQSMKTPIFIEKEIKTTGSASKQLNYFDLKDKIRKYRRANIDTKKMEYELYLKTSLPFASLVFVLIAAPLALAPVKSGKSIGMGLSILIIFVYYIFLSIGKVLGTTGKITPVFSAWIPNIIFMIIGLFLIIRARK